ncbi:MAG: hypothetical protein QJR06_05410 [Alicyclobacillaceae bacterium]|nr:hypothetical protein [Alicyclobacillaceae bacterium]
MEIFVPAVLILSFLATVLPPLLRRRSDGIQTPPDDVEELLEREEMLLAERVDVEYDYQMGKLSYEEYRALVETWEDELRRLTADEQSFGFWKRLEQELQERLRALEDPKTLKPVPKEAAKDGTPAPSSSTGTSH